MISFKLFQRGPIHIHSATFLHLRENSFLLSLDCAQKYPQAMILHSDEFEETDEYEGEPASVTICLYYDENTLNVPEGAPKESDDDYKCTILEVTGFSGEWHVACENGKWGPYIYGVRRMDENLEKIPWPEYSCDEEEDGCEDAKEQTNA